MNQKRRKKGYMSQKKEENKGIWVKKRNKNLKILGVKKV